MNEDVLTFLKSKDVKEKAQRKVNKRKGQEEKERRAKQKVEEEKISYEETIAQARENYKTVLKIIIKDILDSYFKSYHKYSKDMKKAEAIEKSYNLGTSQKGSNYHFDFVSLDYYKKYNDSVNGDKYRKIHYFQIEKDKKDKIIKKIPVILDLEKMNNPKIFSYINIEDNQLKVKVELSIILGLLTLVDSEGLYNIYDASIVDVIKEANEKIKEEHEKILNFKNRINRNTLEIYKYIYKILVEKIDILKPVDEYKVILKTNTRYSEEDEKIVELYYMQAANRNEKILCCEINNNGSLNKILIEKELLKNTLEQDTQFGFIDFIENEQKLVIIFDSKTIESILANPEEIDKGQAITLHRKD